MSNCPLTTTEVPAEQEKEEDLQRKRYYLDPATNTAPEDVRRDRLAHLLLIGLKTVKNRRKDGSGV